MRYIKRKLNRQNYCVFHWRSVLKIWIVIKVTLGFLLLLLGTIGIVVPVWPTTPFVLLAIYLFTSTPIIRKKVLKITFFKHYYENYCYGKQIPKKTVLISFIYLWCMLVISALLVQKSFVIFILFTVGITVTIHIVWIARGRKRNGY